MTTFVDASAIVAILSGESDAVDLTGRVGRGGRLLWSAVTRWEAVAAMTRKMGFDPVLAREAVLAFATDLEITLVPIGEREDALAFEAYRTYGKGGGHPARLNMGDCFAYACAKANGARLLYKGEDFTMTDLG